MTHTFFVDAETDGLYGRFLSVAAMVTDENGAELDRFCAAVPTEADSLESEWVKENVLPYLSCAERFVRDEEELLDAFWDFWMKHRETADCVAYVPVPVEARLFSRCVMKDPANRAYLGPFPLYDLATLMRARGVDPDTDPGKLAGLELTPHDAMNDVRMAAAAWHLLMKEEK